MIILRQNNYSKEDIEEKEEPKKKSHKFLKGTAIVGGSGLALVGGYQLKKHIDRDNAGKNKQRAIQGLFDTVRGANSRKNVDNAIASNKLANKAVKRTAETTKLEDLGHTAEDWIKSRIKKKARN